MIYHSGSIFCVSKRHCPLHIYKIVRRHGATWDTGSPQPRRVTPQLFRHTAAVHLLESGVEVNVIRGCLNGATGSPAASYMFMAGALLLSVILTITVPARSDERSKRDASLAVGRT